MSAKGGRLEAQFTLATAWTFTAEDAGGGPTAKQIDPGSYFVGELIEAFRQELEEVGSEDWVVTVSDDEGSNSTGRVTISNPSGPWSITWGTIALREALGFDLDISEVSTDQTGVQHVRGLWLPAAIKYSQHGDGNAASEYRHASSQTINNAGDVRTIARGGRYVHEGIGWHAVAGRRAKRVQEVVPYESFESWWLDTQAGANGRTMFQPTAKTRLFWDADDDLTYAEGRLILPRGFNPPRLVEHWIGRYRIELPRFEVGSQSS